MVWTVSQTSLTTSHNVNTVLPNSFFFIMPFRQAIEIWGGCRKYPHRAQSLITVPVPVCISNHASQSHVPRVGTLFSNKIIRVIRATAEWVGNFFLTLIYGMLWFGEWINVLGY